jgi:hypothetical protein
MALHQVDGSVECSVVRWFTCQPQTKARGVALAQVLATGLGAFSRHQNIVTQIAAHVGRFLQWQPPVRVKVPEDAKVWAGDTGKYVGDELSVPEVIDVNGCLQRVLLRFVSTSQDVSSQTWNRRWAPDGAKWGSKYGMNRDVIDACRMPSNRALLPLDRGGDGGMASAGEARQLRFDVGECLYFGVRGGNMSLLCWCVLMLRCL